VTVPAVLADRYDAILTDLDGVVYRGDVAVPAAVDTLPLLRDRGGRILFLTNNSARTPAQVADKLRGLGVAAQPDEVLTSAMATAAILKREGSGARTAFVIGERGIREALDHAGIEVRDGEPDRTDLVVVGWDRGVDYAKLRTASLLVQRGARLIATNANASYPAPDGLWPGAGAILAAITTATGAEPVVVGKPRRPLFDAAAEATGASHPLVVGDRLDTDIAGAAALGWDSLLVLSGAARQQDLPRSSVLPTYVADDVSGLLQDLPRAHLRSAHRDDVRPIEALLTSSGLRADGVDGRVSTTILAETGQDDGSVIGTASLVRTADPTAGLLRSVAVADAVRGTGIGRLVTAAAMASGRVEGLERVYLLTETAEGFFERLGFHRIERAELPAAVSETAHAGQECPDAAAMAFAF
jgi:HAD superfamily hydrolase (TIGR01457 family)